MYNHFFCRQCTDYAIGSSAARASSSPDQVLQTLNLSEKVGLGNNDHRHDASSSSNQPCCAICLGVFQTDFQSRLQGVIDRAIESYCCDQTGVVNRFSRQASPPTIILPGDLVFRFCEASKVLRKKKLISTLESSSNRLQAFLSRIKYHAKQVLLDCLNETEHKAQQKAQQKVAESGAREEKYPVCAEEEELGYLGIHVILVPKAHVSRPNAATIRSDNTRKRGRVSRKKHFMSMDGPQQGGDPRQNLEWRLINQQHVVIWTINQALDDSSRWQDSELESEAVLDTHAPADEGAVVVGAIDIHVAIWRRPFYLGSFYTKTRRDVSQTPFFVTEQGKRRRLGVTSVEEQILPPMKRLCKGISTLNNKQGDKNEAIVVYGMAKFHGSGREDMDVRMVVPSLQEECEEARKEASPSTRTTTTATKRKISGRPFACEIIDAFSMPNQSALQHIADEINQPTDRAKTDGANPYINNSLSLQSYGTNPMGVGISGLKFVSSSSFKNLQEQTESKVKHYGCLCWCRDQIPSDQDALNKKLGTFPLEIHQRTPIRVLHRRSNLVRIRHVLTCEATRIDDHHFRLRVSTDAGTCE